MIIIENGSLNIANNASINMLKTAIVFTGNNNYALLSPWFALHVSSRSNALGNVGLWQIVSRKSPQTIYGIGI